MKEAVVQWIDGEDAITLTCDIGTLSGLVMLTELLVSDTTGVTKLAGFKLITSKTGAYCAEKLIEILDNTLGNFKI